MKRIILFTVLLLITTNVYAESPTDKGVYSLGGSISYRNVNSDSGSDSDIFLFSPSAQYFIYDNFAVGASLIYEKTSGTIDNESYGIGPTLRYYLPYKTVNPFFEVGYSYLKNKSEMSSLTLKTTSNNYSIGCGLDFFLSRNVSIEPVIKYSWRDYKDKFSSGLITPTDRDEKSLYIGIGINVFIF